MKKILIFFLLMSCSRFVKMTDETFYEEIETNNSKTIHLVFSHNINGETHPCGCRQFPLGGFEQAYGHIMSLKKVAPLIYVDTGDTFFETTKIPNFILKSSRYKAKKIAEALDMLDLKLMTPGDQDFALGESFLKEIAQKHDFKFLITNASKKLQLPHQKFFHLKVGKKNFFFLGVLRPDLLNHELRSLFVSPKTALKKQLESLKNKYGDLKNKSFILLSHSGLDYDKNLAKLFPTFDWIIGSHSQSFMRYSYDVGQTKLVQVLSRNHYLGEINLLSKKEDAYHLVEMRDEVKNKIQPNPMTPWLQNYKKEYDKINLAQQATDMAMTNEAKTIPTYISCSDCHDKQVEFWQSTAHSLALSTLLNANEMNNPQCIKCHSVGFRKEGGFAATQKFFKSENDFDTQKYLKEFKKAVKINHPVRKLSSSQRTQMAKDWLKFDKDHGITANYGNVQCLNCHNQTADHPFEIQPESKDQFKNKCLNCHTADQSPKWYDKDSNGLATSLNEKYFAKKLKEVSCPKIE